ECRAFAAARGWDIIREFLPANGYASGLSIERDAGFQEMVRVAESRSHGVRYLIVYDVSRFGRLITDEKIYWEQRFKKHGGIQIVYVHGDIQHQALRGYAARREESRRFGTQRRRRRSVRL